MGRVYICDRNGQLYIGITTDLDHLMRQHKAGLLYTEAHKYIHEAAKRESQIKGWRRKRNYL
jgi:predicted GIY-YIG superfamily endonuclease